MIKKLLIGALVSAAFFTHSQAKEKYFVVERESSSVAVIENGLPRHHMQNMHNMNHGVIKFYDNDGYLISRDGYIVRFDPRSEKKLNEYKTSKSAIGFVINKNYVAVANYDDKSVDILSRDLKPIEKIKTGSRNVGIKIYKNYLVFSEMDKDAIAIYEDVNRGRGKPHFKLVKEFKNVGVMPFDAMIKGDKYINGFFQSPWFGVVDLDTLKFEKIQLQLDDRKPVLKVPHFGFWSISDSKVFIPAVGDNKVFVFTPDFKFIKAIKTEGLPVFTALSPDKKYLAVTFSGKKFPVIQIIDTKTLRVIKRFEFDGKVLHLRWSNEKPELYISVNDSNKVAVLNTKGWWLKREILTIKKPSGIFIYQKGK
ncbi:cytochrome D1 domain-containing protein [Sulfurimonas paralvinellae]|uniref:Nitrite reductase n=1 Tax=Sulfurimonas paralvinellae TaxID=317658 RepID=A0A7M1B6Q0_9BACT|nr:cytochrome D1 domain-containing protein [Sulfurimonas paralvinellae]QOP45394.1 nitrite reductase [Sulfurimonas paralvinellae]